MTKDFCLFILSHGRPDNVTTYDVVRKCGYTGRIVIVVDDEDETLEGYRETFGEENLYIFNKDEQAFDKGDNFHQYRALPSFAREAVWKYVRVNNIKKFCVMDDDLLSISYRWITEDFVLKTKTVENLDSVFSCFCEMLDVPNIYVLSFGLAADFVGGAKNPLVQNGFYYNSRNTFFCNADKYYTQKGRIYEDCTTPLYYNSFGCFFWTILKLQITMQLTVNNKGGSSEYYNDITSYSYYGAFHQVLFMPSCTKMVMQKSKKFEKFITKNNAYPKIIRENCKKVVNNG